jgi:2-polyprenyl-3-methyl-5-hydroxy-6-metoxy-1,4-benzoquinol methylase
MVLPELRRAGAGRARGLNCIAKARQLGVEQDMAVDHSATYRGLTFRNLPHRLRLRAIESELRRLAVPRSGTYADFGCSNGFITERVASLVAASSGTGFDHQPENLDLARSRYPHLTFQRIDLNRPGSDGVRFDLVTCFETLEHAGDMYAALGNVIAAIKPGGIGMLTVPIEIGPKGVLKFLIKTLVYGYSLQELPNGAQLRTAYLKSLLVGERISRYREVRAGWRTHFGFDYRDLDDRLRQLGVPFSAVTRGFARFYVIRPRSESPPER